MQGNNLKDQDASKLNRRKFLTRAGAGFVIASIPGKSVWAGSAGLTNSIVASGQGSDFAGTNLVKLQSPGWFKNNQTSQNSTIFKTCFNGTLIGVNGHDNCKLGDVLDQPGQNKLGGPSNINFNLAGMYLNAFFGSGGFSFRIEPNDKLYYPIVGPGRAFASYSDFAFYLYTKAKLYPSAVSAEIDLLINRSNLHGN